MQLIDDLIAFLAAAIIVGFIGCLCIVMESMPASSTQLAPKYTNRVLTDLAHN